MNATHLRAVDIEIGRTYLSTFGAPMKILERSAAGVWLAEWPVGNSTIAPRRTGHVVLKDLIREIRTENSSMIDRKTIAAGVD